MRPVGIAPVVAALGDSGENSFEKNALRLLWEAARLVNPGAMYFSNFVVPAQGAAGVPRILCLGPRLRGG